ncbi:hypothetical protein BJY00DRAFT_274984 [Aspergillus carlsbadensis]|nr:hypothetical protein BJY00DRAFT_274984 [Aspergillus carlsbadensis]
MMGRCILFLLAAQLLGGVSASAVGSPPLRTVRAADDTTVAIKRALNDAAGTTYTLNRTHLTKSWADATLFSLGLGTTTSTTNNSTGTDQTLELESALTVICTACYINGSVTGTLNITNDFNLTSAVSSLGDEISNVTSSALDQLSSFAENATHAVLDAITDFSIDDGDGFGFGFDDLDLPAWPTLDLDFDLDEMDGFPDVHAQIEFTDLELYLELDVILSAGATYTLNLFTSQSVAGIKIPGLEAGVLFKVDLVLIAEAEIDVSSGFHVKLDQGLLLDFALFKRDVGGVTLPGGLLEFLPITITGSGSLRALLQLSTSIGFELATPGLAFLADIPGLDIGFSTGVSAEVFAYVADLQLGVNATTDDDADCALEAVAQYTLAVGAAAGATVAVHTYQWGPAPSVTVPVWYTTLGSFCAGERSDTSTSSTITSSTSGALPTPTRGLLEERQRTTDEAPELHTITLTSSTKYTLTGCRSTGLANCPASLQTTTSTQREMTTVLTVESGVTPSFPVSTFSTLSAAIAFGENVRSLGALSGVPVSYVPPRETETETAVSGGEDEDEDELGEEEESSDGNDDKLIIGLSVGLGVPVLLGLAAGAWYVYPAIHISSMDLIKDVC